MKLRKHFRTSESIINLIVSDFSYSRISDKNIYFRYCVDRRIQLLSEKYDSKIDRLLTFIIMNCSYDNLPLHSLAKIIMSLSKVTNILSKGFISLISK